MTSINIGKRRSVSGRKGYESVEYLERLNLPLHEYRLFFRLSNRWQSGKSREPVGDLARGCQMSEVQVREAVKGLTKKGLVKERHLTQQEIKEIVANKKPQNLSVGSLVCEWCKGSTLVLEKHHYPVPKKEGGEETVSICGNCHAEFHFLELSPFLETTVLIAWV